MKAHELNLAKTGRLVDPDTTTTVTTTTNQQSLVVPEKVVVESPTNIQGGLAAFKAQSTGEGAGSLLQAQVHDEKKHRGRTSALKPAVINNQLGAAEKKAFRQAAALETEFKALGLGDAQS
jgi:hypothetical protein